MTASEHQIKKKKGPPRSGRASQLASASRLALLRTTLGGTIMVPATTSTSASATRLPWIRRGACRCIEREPRRTFCLRGSCCYLGVAPLLGAEDAPCSGRSLMWVKKVAVEVSEREARLRKSVGKTLSPLYIQAW